MKRIALGLGGLLLLVIIAIVVAPMLIPGKVFKSLIEKQATTALARNVTIAETPKFSLFPNPAFAVRGLTIANAEGFSAPSFAAVDSARIKVKLFPLFSRNVIIDEFVLTDPVVALEQKADGSANWLLGQATSTAPADNSASTSEESLKDISLGDVRIVNGSFTFDDRKSNQTFKAEKTNVVIKLDSLSSPLNAKGDMLFQGAPTNLDITLTTPKALMENKAATVKLRVELENNLIDTAINLAGGAFAYDGTLTVDAPTLRSLLAVLGMPLTAETGFDKLRLSGAVLGSENAMSFKQAEIVFDEIKGSGDLDFAWGGVRPTVNGKLNLDVMDLRPYLPEPDAATKANQTDKSAPFPAWSEEDMNFDFLKTVDGKFTATTKGILLHGIELGDSALTATLKGGAMTANLDALTMYGGKGKGVMVLDATRAVPSMNANFTMDALNAKNFASAVMGLNRLAGLGDVTFNLTASGKSQAALMRSLNGTGSFDLKEGALEGIDLGGMTKSVMDVVKGLRAGQIDAAAFSSAVASARGANAKTDFSSMGAAFEIANGIVQTQNVSLKGPYFTVSGGGSVNLPGQTLALTLKPVLSELQDGTGKSFAIPLQISGGFNGASVSVDTRTLLSSLADSSLRDLLTKNGISVPDGASIRDALKGVAEDKLKEQLGVSGDASVGDALKDKANTELGKLISGAQPQPTTETAPDAAATTPEKPLSLQEQLKKRAADELARKLEKQNAAPEPEPTPAEGEGTTPPEEPQN